MIVHYLRAGAALCGYENRAVPRDWPVGMWSDNAADVNCAECRAHPYISAPIACLRLHADDFPWLCIEDTPRGREDGLQMIFGDLVAAADAFKPDPHQAIVIGEAIEHVDKLLVERCTHTRAELDALPEWEP